MIKHVKKSKPRKAAARGDLRADALRDSELRYRRLFEAAQDGILILDAATGTIEDANPFILKLLGFSHGQLAGKKLWEIGAFKDVFANKKKFRELQAQGYVRYEGLPLVAADGRKLFVEFVSNVYDVSGLKVIQCNIRDNTARLQAEAEKETLNAELLRKNAEIEGFLHITTHDLRTPLVNIQGFSKNLAIDLGELHALVEGAELPGEVKARALKLLTADLPESLGYIEGSVVKMGMLITALLKVSRLGRQELSTVTVNMDSLLKSSLATFAYRLEKQGGKVKVESLPLCSADPAAVAQIFANLLDNAIKYRDKTRKLEVIVKGEAKDPHTVRYTVADNGRGIKEADLERIWEVFYSGHTQDPEIVTGEGIGLTVARRMAERCGGNLTAESREGAGAKFILELPARGV
jgi:PAS domain S-box-containing protein